MAEALQFVVSCSKSVNASPEEEGDDSRVKAMMPAGLPAHESNKLDADLPVVLDKIPELVEWAPDPDPDPSPELLEPGRAPDDVGQKIHWSIVGVGYRSDAANSRIWRRKKLSVSSAKVLWIQDFEMLKQGHFEKAVTVRRCVQLGNLINLVHCHCVH